ncbi:MAG: ZIP family metal transporter [Clostridiales bacterium]|nr:ZIP family metal transporter [Clostridiales bacterium]
MILENLLKDWPLVYIALGCGAFMWAVTALGAAAVFMFPSLNKRAVDTMTGFAAGVMIAASFWSLLSPAIDLCEAAGKSPWLAPASGFVTGGAFVMLAGLVLEKVMRGKINSNVSDGGAGNSCGKNNAAGGNISDGGAAGGNVNSNTSACVAPHRGLLLAGSVTLHNIPEGLSVGVAFGAAAAGLAGCTVLAGITLAIGIAIQNFPEGASVSMPLLGCGAGRKKAFFFGQLSGLVEPLAVIAGFYLSAAVRGILPFALAFSAGAMIAVTASELIPEASNSKFCAAFGCIVGFALMMILDVTL